MVAGSRVDVLRGGVVESAHVVRVAVARADGSVRARSGDVEAPVFARSCIKPFQALPLVEDGVVEALGLTGEELALCCASHNAEPRHVTAAASILSKAGVSARALACGPHPPTGDAAARALAEAGQEPGRIHNNCSGKHAGMLALCVHNGWPTEGYHLPAHPVQRRVAATLAAWSGVEEHAMATATDGCGVVTFGLPLRGLATAFARLGASAWEEGGSAAGRVVGAMTDHPFYVAGTGRMCTELMEVAGGRVFAKTGAEGVYGAGVPEAGLGIALKVEDGAKRASEPALLAVLGALGVLSERALERLGRWAAPALTNTRDEVVGSIRAILELEDVDG